MASEDFSSETNLSNSLLSCKEEPSFIDYLKIYCSKIEDDSYAATNTTVRKKVCNFLKDQIIECKNGKLIYEVLKLILKFTRNTDLINVFDKEFVSILQKLAVTNEFQNYLVNMFAWKCLSNIIYVSKGSKEFVGDKIFIKQLKDEAFDDGKSFDEKILLLKIIYLITALNKSSRTYLTDECNLRRLLINRLNSCFSVQSNSNTSLLSVEACTMACEVLKVVFTVMMDLRQSNIRTENTIKEIDELIELCRKAFHSKAEDNLSQKELYCSAGNAAYSISINDFKIDLFLPPICSSKNKLIDVSESRDIVPIVSLLKIMEAEVMQNTNSKDVVVPIFAFFAQLSRLNSGVRRYLKQQVLPPRKNFRDRPEDGKKLPHKLIKLLTNIDLPLKLTVADFLFVLCKEKVDKFVKYTGYGNAAGLLASRGLLCGGRGDYNYSSSDSDSDTEEYKAVAKDIDPVTGHIPQPVKTDPMKGMSDEQKEYLAVKLANEISKLSSDSPLQPMCVSDDGKLITMTEKFHNMQTEEESSSDES